MNQLICGQLSRPLLQDLEEGNITITLIILIIPKTFRVR